MNRCSTSGRCAIIFSVVAIIGVYQSGMQSVWSMNGIVVDRDACRLSARRISSQPSKIQTKSYWLRSQPDPVVDVADVGEAAPCSGRRPRTSRAS